MLFQLFHVWLLFSSCRSLEGPSESWACGFCVLTVCTGCQPGSTKMWQCGPRDCCTSLWTKRKLVRGGEAFVCLVFPPYQDLTCDSFCRLVSTNGVFHCLHHPVLSGPWGPFLVKCSATWTCSFCFHGKQIFENLMQEHEISWFPRSTMC